MCENSSDTDANPRLSFLEFGADQGFTRISRLSEEEMVEFMTLAEAYPYALASLLYKKEDKEENRDLLGSTGLALAEHCRLSLRLQYLRKHSSDEALKGAVQARMREIMMALPDWAF